MARVLLIVHMYMHARKMGTVPIESLLDSLNDRICLSEKQIKVLLKTTVEGGFGVIDKAVQIEFTSITCDLIKDAKHLHGSVCLDPLSTQIISDQFSALDKNTILREIQNKIIGITQHPEIRLTITDVSTGFGHDVALLKGTLFLRGKAHRIALPLKLIGPSRLAGNITILQSHFGITDAQTFESLIRTKNEIEVLFEIFFDPTMIETK